MDRLELRLEAPGPETPMERPEDECRRTTVGGWMEPDAVPCHPRSVLLLGVEPDDEAPD
jgi:hypothetical protein